MLAQPNLSRTNRCPGIWSVFGALGLGAKLISMMNLTFAMSAFCTETRLFATGDFSLHFEGSQASNSPLAVSWSNWNSESGANTTSPCVLRNINSFWTWSSVSRRVIVPGVAWPKLRPASMSTRSRKEPRLSVANPGVDGSKPVRVTVAVTLISPGAIALPDPGSGPWWRFLA